MSKEISANTVSKAEEVSLTWKIENFTEIHCGHKSSITGPTFSLPTRPESSWQSFVDVYEKRTKEHYIFYRAQLLSYPSNAFVRINYNLYVITDDQSKELKKSKTFIVGKNGKKYIHVFLGYIYDLEQKKQLHKNALTLECHFSIIRNSTKEDVASSELSLKSLNCLSGDFETLYFSKTFSDFTIVVENAQFPVHKCVLSARSQIFSAMLKNETLENLSNKLEIKDFSAKAVEIMILYLYTGQLDNLSSDMYLELYLVSDKYLLLSLKKVCTYKLVRNLHIGNVCDVYVIGYYHYDSTLKSAAQKYIFENIHSLLRSDNWKKLVAENNQLAADLLKATGIL